MLQVMLLPLAMARALIVQRITYGRRATCRRSRKLAMSLPALLTMSQLLPYSSRLPLFR